MKSEQNACLVFRWLWYSVFRTQSLTVSCLYWALSWNYFVHFLFHRFQCHLQHSFWRFLAWKLFCHSHQKLDRRNNNNNNTCHIRNKHVHQHGEHYSINNNNNVVVRRGSTLWERFQSWCSCSRFQVLVLRCRGQCCGFHRTDRKHCLPHHNCYNDEEKFVQQTFAHTNNLWHSVHFQWRYLHGSTVAGV